LKADGTLGLKNTARNTTLRDLCKTNNTKLIPTISNSSAEELSKVLNNEDLLTNHINLIIKEVETYQYNGIDIDYEYINELDRDKFTNFINLLSSELHKNNKVLTIAILWKTNLDTIIENFSSSRAAQDWATLGEAVDEFRIMAYDYTSSTDTEGPISPKDWISEILDYGLSKVSADKIVLGLPLYAYEWTDENKGAKALVWNDVLNIKNNKEYTIIEDILDEEKFEKRLTLKTTDMTKVIWYQDSEATNQRIDLAQTFGINKFVFWRLGGEDSGIWNLKNN
jgi:spore germination protein YaaH